ncbi:MAG: hypothetical protein LAO76_26355 [Acidobacteriia bacterium]|nr:hypothetical protein [Terriglobia bacterium]
MKDAPETASPVRQFLAASRPDNVPSEQILRSSDSGLDKAAVFTLIVVMQAAVVIWFGYHLHGKLEEILSEHSDILLAGAHENHNGITLVALAFFDLCSKIAISLSWCAAILWWLGQQKKLLKP